VLAGSLPKGVAPDYCARLIRLLKAKGKQVIFDCSGAALSEGIKAAPTLVKPNLEELSQWAGRPVKTLSEQAECARALQASGIPNVVISNGADDWTPEQTLRLATAVSALAVSQVAVGFNDINVLKPLLEQVRVQRLDDLAPTQPQPHLMANSGDAQ